MGLPTEPVICEEDKAVAGLTSDVKSVQAAATTPNVGTNRRPNARTNRGQFLVTVNTNAVGVWPHVGDQESSNAEIPSACRRERAAEFAERIP
jgi:hypothetical protein